MGIRDRVYDAAVKAGRGGSVTINAVPAAQTVKGGKAGELRTLSQEELSAYLSSSDVQKARSGRFDSSYLIYLSLIHIFLFCPVKGGSVVSQRDDPPSSRR